MFVYGVLFLHFCKISLRHAAKAYTRYTVQVFTRIVKLKCIRAALGHRSVSCEPLSTAACSAVLEYRRAARALYNLDY
ncbi:hypothetical protein HMPREF3232_00593 [Fannyhessea vaginae]|nr:hypothetical protein HMPREF3232_00593 [Fannyhessea vaginae]